MEEPTESEKANGKRGGTDEIKPFRFRERIWTTSELAAEYRRLRARAGELDAKRQSVRLTDQEGKELFMIWNDLEKTVGPELQGRLEPMRRSRQDYGKEAEELLFRGNGTSHDVPEFAQRKKLKAAEGLVLERRPDKGPHLGKWDSEAAQRDERLRKEQAERLVSVLMSVEENPSGGSEDTENGGVTVSSVDLGSGSESVENPEKSGAVLPVAGSAVAVPERPKNSTDSKKRDRSIEVSERSALDGEQKRLKKLDSENPVHFSESIEETRQALVRERARLDEWKGREHPDETYIGFLESNISEIERKIALKEADLEYVMEPELKELRIAELESRKSDLSLTSDEALANEHERARSRIETLTGLIRGREGEVAAAESDRHGLVEQLNDIRSERKKKEDFIIGRLGSHFVSEDHLRQSRDEEESPLLERLRHIDESRERLRLLRAALARERESIGDILEDMVAGEVRDDGNELTERTPMSEDGIIVEKSEESGDPTKETMNTASEPVITAETESGPENKSPEPMSGDTSGKPFVFNGPALQLHQEFGIRMRDLENEVPAFGTLTRDQQLFAVEMLRQTAVNKIEDVARDTTKAGITKGYRLAKTRKDLVERMASGGIGTYGEELRQLVNGIHAAGLDLEEKDGKFDVRFLTISAGMAENEIIRKECESYNEAANRFSKIPQEWSYEGATKKQRQQYADERKLFEDAGMRVEHVIFTTERGDDAAAYAGLTQEYGALRIAENRVSLVQHIQSHPEIGEYLNDIRERGSISSFLRTTLVERGAYFAGGAAGRMAVGGAVGMMGVAGTLGLAVAPLVSFFTGGVMANRRAKEALSDLDRKSRRGIDERAAESKKSEDGWFGNMMRSVALGSEKRLAAGKRAMVRATVPMTEKEDGRKRGLSERLDIILGRIDSLSPDAAEARERELGNLLARVEYVKKKLDEDKVSFGDDAEGIRGRVRLLESLSRAELTLGLFADSNEKAEGSVSVRFGRMFGERQRKEDGRVDSAREAYVRHETIKGAVISGSISTLGVGVAHWVGEWAHPQASHSGSETARTALDRVYGSEKVIEDTGGTSVPGQSAIGTVAEGVRPEGSAVETVRQMTDTAGAGVSRAGDIFTSEAKSGEGMTHLARRAFAEYTAQNPKLSGLSAEQKVYIEDYLQKKTAHVGVLGIGERVGFSRQLIDEAVAKARGLGSSQVENLHQFSERVSGFGKEVSMDDGAAIHHSVEVVNPPVIHGGDVVPEMPAPSESIKDTVLTGENVPVRPTLFADSMVKSGIKVPESVVSSSEKVGKFWSAMEEFNKGMSGTDARGHYVDLAGMKGTPSEDVYTVVHDCARNDGSSGLGPNQLKSFERIVNAFWQASGKKPSGLPIGGESTAQYLARVAEWTVSEGKRVVWTLDGVSIE
ncbi:MAG: hypothetical protein HGA31_01600 [Candidatus Moranbacteria bacterium]|nr:hypothetical protein [Candidatus Moranbacteria bacterium]